MAKIKHLLTLLRRYFLALITRHHFVCLLIVLCGFIAWAGAIFWLKAYLPANTPLTLNSALVKVDRESAQKLQEMMNQRQTNLANVARAKFPNLFR